MKKSRKAIITCAVTGSVHTPTMSDALPITPEEIAAQSIEAAEAGAAIIHLHARDPRTGAPTPDPEVFLQFVPEIKSATDVVLNISTGGSTAMTLDERLAAAKQLAPEVATLNMGSMNFVFAGAAARYSEWKHPWEKEYVLGSADRVFANTFRQIEYSMKRLGEEGG